MNIAILIPTLTAGGAERAASLIGNYFAENGHKVFFFLFSNSRHSFFKVQGEIVKTHITYPFEGSAIPKNIREMFFASKKLKRLKKKYCIEVAISFMEAWNLLNVCSRNYGERVILSIRTVLSERDEGAADFIYNRRILNCIYNRADRIITVSDWVKNDMINNYGIKNNILQTIPNISVKRTIGDENIFGKWNYGEKVAVCIGRLDPVKQFDCIIRAFSYAHEIDSEMKLIIVGDGRQMKSLLDLRSKYNLNDSVIFVGSCNDVGYFLKNANCFVMASKVEGFPNVMLEAMAYGVPVVSTDSPGGCGEILGRKHKIKDIECCEYGIMTPYIKRKKQCDSSIKDEEKMLGKAIYEIISNTELHSKYAQQSTKRSKYYGTDNIMRLWDKLLEI